MPTEEEILNYPYISRAQAKLKGLRYFKTQHPCRHGHYSLRHVVNGGCYVCNNHWQSRYEKKRRELREKEKRDFANYSEAELDRIYKDKSSMFKSKAEADLHRWASTRLCSKDAIANKFAERIRAIASRRAYLKHYPFRNSKKEYYQGILRGYAHL